MDEEDRGVSVTYSNGSHPSLCEGSQNCETAVRCLIAPYRLHVRTAQKWDGRLGQRCTGLATNDARKFIGGCRVAQVVWFCGH